MTETETETETEPQQLVSLAADDVAELRLYACAWCQHPMHLPGCDALYSRCSVPQRLARRRSFLSEIRARRCVRRPDGRAAG